MRSTLGKVSAIMILLVFIIGSILVLNIARAQNDTFNENQTNNSINVLENVIINDAVDNGTISEDFVLGSGISQNILLNETVEIVTSIVNQSSEENETSDETSQEPVFVVNFGSGRITRGEIVVLNTIVMNTGSWAKGVYLDWVLPDEFEIVSGNLRENCGDLDKDDSCYSEISVMIDSSTEIGSNEIKIVVNYEK